MPSEVRRQQVEILFGGFIAWLVHDEEKRGEQEYAHDRLKAPSRTLDNGSEPWYQGYVASYGATPAKHGSIRELLLIHTISEFLHDAVPRPEQKLGAGIFAARFPAFETKEHFGGLRILQSSTRDGRDGPELAVFALKRPSEIADPSDLFLAFYLSDAEPNGDWPVGFPDLEGVLIGHRKYYDIKLHEDDWAYRRACYQGEGGAVIDFYQSFSPFQMIGDGSEP
ncbi:hypothetical protein K432DRAFT_409460 [Lepidopterella palustris CBS 459.81]|uniref:Uncharacterized protein n=1 Tax=Lepidopterella palustris CBS 459.81 TaxID=1314670 RepID=A0A8E2JA01_9PEZI|nr:hypothetical protein K432DRAFT_409460 [Lepidopterella palustris CBS 459.81]